MAKRGRPTKFDQIFIQNKEQLKTLIKKGFTDAELAKFFEVDPRTVENWKKNHPEFFQSLKEWKKSANRKVERALFERAVGYSHPEDKIFLGPGGKTVIEETIKHYPPDTAAAFIWLKNRDHENWRDKHEVDITGKLDRPLSDEERDILAAHGFK